MQIAFAVGLPSKHARYTARALDSGLPLLPHTTKVALSDNGSEFEADFAQLLKERGIKRWYTYPETPKMNARRSIQSNDPGVLRGLPRGAALYRPRPLQPQTDRLAGRLRRRAPAPYHRPAFPVILPPATSTRGPKVLDSYMQLTLIGGMCLNCAPAQGRLAQR